MAILVSDIVNLIQLAMNNRQDITTTNNAVLNAIYASVMEITESYPFDELRETGPSFTLTVGTNIYPITSWLQANRVNTTQICVFSLLYPNSGVPANSDLPPIPLDYMYPKAIDPLTVATGPCNRWTRFGSDIILAPTPDQAYSTYMRYQFKHPFTTPLYPAPTDTIYLPESWIDILTYSSAMRYALSIRATDVWEQYHSILYGDPEYQMSQGKQGRPGIIAARVFNQERDAQNNVGSIMPVLQNY